MKKKKEEKKYSTKEVAVLCECEDRTVRKWAAADGNVFFTGAGNRKDYRLTKADIERFKSRPRPGRRWS